MEARYRTNPGDTPGFFVGDRIADQERFIG